MAQLSITPGKGQPARLRSPCLPTQTHLARPPTAPGSSHAPPALPVSRRSPVAAGRPADGRPHGPGRRSAAAQGLHCPVQRQGPFRLARHAAFRPLQAGRHVRGPSARPRSTKWTDDAKKHWTVENGELVNDGNGAYLTTDKDFGDIELLIDYKTVPKADSGIYLRATPQVQIWDYTKEGRQVEPRRRQGQRRPVEQQPRHARQGPARPGRQAVRRVEQLPHPHGRRARHRLPQRQARRRSRPPGELLGPQEAAAAEGPDPAADARRRNPLAEHLHPRDPRRRGQRDPAQARHAKGFESVFNGKDFTGWAGPVDKYEVKDGAIVCKPNKGGTIYTKDEYADFVARVEYQLPPGGNNGLAIRYPGQGDTRLRRHVRGAGARRHRPAVRQARSAAVQRLGLRHGGRPTAATCGRSASGTSRR